MPRSYAVGSVRLGEVRRAEGRHEYAPALWERKTIDALVIDGIVIIIIVVVVVVSVIIVVADVVAISEQAL